MTKRGRFFIADPSLKDIRGHHYRLTQNASRSAQMAGFEAFWLAAADCPPDIETTDAAMFPCFTTSMYDNYTDAYNSQSALGALIARLTGKLERIFGIEKPKAPSKNDLYHKIYTEDLTKAFDHYTVNSNDRCFIHTADGGTYPAIATLVNQLPEDKTPIFHVCTPYDPDGIMPNCNAQASVADAIASLKACGVINKTVFFYGENPVLAEHLSNIWSTHVRPLDLPAANYPASRYAHARKYRKETLNVSEDQFLVVTLGSARLEKGFHKLPDIVSRAYELAESIEFPDICGDTIKFALHASPQIIGRHPIILDTLEQLKTLSRDRLLLIETPLSDEEYEALLLAGDAVILPYEEDDYRFRGSGVVSEALTAGKPIIATTQSYPGVVALAQGGGTGQTPADLAQALVRLAQERRTRHKKIIAARDDYLTRNSIEDYAPKLFAAETQATFEA